MKFLTVLALGLFAFSAFSADDLSSAKKKKTDDIDRKMNALKEYRTCVVGASSTQVVESCRYRGPEGVMQEEEVIDVEPMKQDTKDDMNKKKGSSGY
ncbi:hypothetical protein ACJVC5_12235 [Peredibacter sp. HCB2-198]|uniref:hypothetical protein n=1 Tax=Peredibacter sp. HCB2-198 TaxID=3383025 RepID=UPI0038B4A284